MGTIVIYGIFHPDKPDMIRYIGKTKKSINERLRQHIYLSKKNVKRPLYLWITKMLKENKIPEIKVIEKVIKNCLIKSKIISFDNEIKNISKWTVIGEEGSYHVTHKHNLLNSNVKSAISTVTYLKVPEKLNNDPSGKFYAFLRSNELITISPKVGDIFIFPVWIYHGTYPQSKGTRQTLNLDFKFR